LTFIKNDGKIHKYSQIRLLSLLYVQTAVIRIEKAQGLLVILNNIGVQVMGTDMV